jgi:hypothetical protein
MRDAGEAVTIALVARRAGVSRSWIYTQPALRNQIQQLQRYRAETETSREATIRASDDSLRQRLPLAHERISQLRAENHQVRDALAHAHGQVRRTPCRVDGYCDGSTGSAQAVSAKIGSDGKERSPSVISAT